MFTYLSQNILNFLSGGNNAYLTIIFKPIKCASLSSFKLFFNHFEDFVGSQLINNMRGINIIKKIKRLKKPKIKGMYKMLIFVIKNVVIELVISW